MRPLGGLTSSELSYEVVKLKFLREAEFNSGIMANWVVNGRLPTYRGSQTFTKGNMTTFNMDNLPDDEANLKYELALIELRELADRPPNVEQLRYKWKLEQRLLFIQADKAIMDACYEGDDGV